MTKLHKIIHDTAKIYAEDFPGKPFEGVWSVIAYEIAGADETGLSWTEYHAAVEAELVKLAQRSGSGNDNSPIALEGSK